MPFERYTQTDMVLSERRRLEYPLLAMLWMGVAIFSLVQGEYFHLILMTAAVAVNLYAINRSQAIYLPRLAVNIGVIVATGILVAELYQVYLGQQLQLVAMAHYLMLLQICKLFERKTNRDYVQMLTLSLLLMLVPAIMSESLWFAGLLVGYLAMACYTAMIFTLKRGLDGAARAMLPGETVATSPEQIAWNVIHYWPARALRRGMVFTILVILVVAAASFLLVPRGQAEPTPFFFGLKGKTESASGFSSTVRLGDSNGVYLSSQIQMSVRIGSIAPGVPLPESAFYLRGRVFDRYVRSKWITTASGFAPVVPPPPQLLSEGVTMDVAMSPALNPVLFACYLPVAVGIDRFNGVPEINGNMELKVQSPNPGMIRYKAHSWIPPLRNEQRQFLLDTLRSRGQKEPAVFQPDVPARVPELARQWCRDLLDRRPARGPERDRLDQAIAHRIALRLAERCSYSLEFADADPRSDGVDDFLFHLRRGHCEYFASALTVMCNLLDVRARLATGFRIERTVAAAGGEIPVRGSDAHAWAEIYTPSTDWTIVEATPAGGSAARTGWWMAVKNWWADVQFYWYQKVIGYDAFSQAMLSIRISEIGTSFKNECAATWSRWVANVRRWKEEGSWQAAILLISAGGVLVGLAVQVVLIGGLIRRRRGSRRTRWQNSLAHPGQRQFARKLLALLGHHMRKAAPGWTLREAARLVAARGLLPGGELDDLVQLYYEMRWGRHAASPEEIAAAESRLDGLRRILEHGGF